MVDAISARFHTVVLNIESHYYFTNPNTVMTNIVVTYYNVLPVTPPYTPLP